MAEKIVKLSEQELLEGASIKSFPQFSSFDAFLESDFFQKYYYLGKELIKVPWMFGIAEQEQQKISRKVCEGEECKEIIDYLGTIPQNRNILIENLQRMLLALGYLKFEDFDSTNNTGEDESIDDINVSYFGFLGSKERKAIERFQANMKLEHIDGIIGLETRTSLYEKMYQNFHSDSITEATIRNLKRLEEEL